MQKQAHKPVHAAAGEKFSSIRATGFLRLRKHVDREAGIPQWQDLSYPVIVKAMHQRLECGAG
jgi:hypothetical protein